MNMKKFLTVLILGIATFAVSCSNDTTDSTKNNDVTFTIGVLATEDLSAAEIESIANITVNVTKGTASGGAIVFKNGNEVTGATAAGLIQARLRAVTTTVSGYDLSSSIVEKNDDAADNLADGASYEFKITLTDDDDGSNDKEIILTSSVSDNS